MELTEPPRRLSSTAKRDVWFARPLLVVGLLTSLLVTLAVFFLLIAYNLGFSYHRASGGESVTVNSQISIRERESLASGGVATVVKAQVKVNDTILTVRGYGPKTDSAKVGDAVTIVIPKDQVDAASLVGYWPRATTPSLLLQFALWFYGPAAVAILLSLWGSFRDRNRLLHGQEVEAAQNRALALPRPMSDHVLAHWKYQDSSGASKTFWTLQKQDEDSLVLCDQRGASLFNRLLPQATIENDELVGHSLVRRVLGIFSILLLAIQFLVVACYLLT